MLVVKADAAAFWKLADRFVPERDSPDFDSVVERARLQLRLLSPRTLVIPGPTDCHGDHRAAWAIWTEAAKGSPGAPRILEYLVWPGTDAVDAVPLRLD